MADPFTSALTRCSDFGPASTVVLPFLTDEEAERTFADQGGVRRLRSYLRFVRDPSLRIF